MQVDGHDLPWMVERFYGSEAINRPYQFQLDFLLMRAHKEFKLEVGSQQIALDPTDLQMASINKRQPTGWGYGDFGSSPDMTGIPVLKYNWRENN